jgi:hypothetical protein
VIFSLSREACLGLLEGVALVLSWSRLCPLPVASCPSFGSETKLGQDLPCSGELQSVHRLCPSLPPPRSRLLHCITNRLCAGPISCLSTTTVYRLMPFCPQLLTFLTLTLPSTCINLSSPPLSPNSPPVLYKLSHSFSHPRFHSPRKSFLGKPTEYFPTASLTPQNLAHHFPPRDPCLGRVHSILLCLQRRVWMFRHTLVPLDLRTPFPS